jgi:serine/threonine protein kinase
VGESFARSRIGHFEVLRELGHGGMGVVYEARDEKLGRTVALKVLPEALAADGMRRDRFLREARAAAQVSHAAIATVYEVGESDGRLYIAMEHVEGRTLREHLSDGPLPPERALEVGRQIAGALARAHQAGIVHRDLKPENVMLSEDGQVKILDFGIAKALAGDQGLAAGSWTTREGAVLGTPGYMAPEQAAGKKSDQRADVFAFGVLIYEMLTGRAPFVGETPMERVAAVLRDEPAPMDDGPEGAPEELRALIAACLEKDPDARPRGGSALVSALRGTASVPRAVVRAQPSEVDPLARTLATPTEEGQKLTSEVAALVAAQTSGAGSPATTTVSRDEPGRRSRFSQFAKLALLGVAVIAATTTITYLLLRRAPRREHVRAVSSKSVEPPLEARAPGPERKTLPPVWPCEGERTRRPERRCSADALAWCDAQGRQIGCCARGLVPIHTSGACGCPPGGSPADAPAAASCARAGSRAGLDQETVQRVVRAHRSELRGCFEQSLGPASAKKGRIVLFARVSPDGRIFSARIVESSLPSPAAQSCVLQAWKHLTFPPIPGGLGYELTFPLDFDAE